MADQPRNRGACSPSATEEKAPVTEEEKEATAASHTAAASHVMSNLTWSPARQRHIHLFAAFTVTGAGLPIPCRRARDLARFLLTSDEARNHPLPDHHNEFSAKLKHIHNV